jgi:murein DD-endopeptidase MepM/ murein hydrolase activator NlpD
MEKVLFFFTHYGIPATLLLIQLMRRPKSLLGLWAAVAFFASMLLFLFVWGQWPLVGSYYGRLLPVVVLGVLVWSAVRRARAKLPARSPRMIATVGSALLLALTAWVSYGVVKAYAGSGYPEPVVDLDFPLRGGRYYVSSGGSSRIINNHMRDFPNPQEYALDINKLGPAGGVSSNILSADNRLHHIFGEEVYAPCGGRVTKAVSDLADNAGASMDVAPEDGTGNLVVIDCAGVVVAMPHLKSGSVVVSSGEHVTAGQLLGRVGNSGFSQEPHLHLQAARRNETGDLIGIPMRFAGRTYSRNDVISATGR